MTDTPTPTAGAMRAAKIVCHRYDACQSRFELDLVATLIDRETKPLKLLADNRRLLKALRAMMDTHGNHGPCEANDCHTCALAYEKAKDAIPATKGTP